MSAGTPLPPHAIAVARVRALRWDFVTDPPTKLLADLEAARVRLRRGQYRAAASTARRLLRTTERELGLPSRSVARQLVEVQACACAVRGIAAARLGDPDAGEALDECIRAFERLVGDEIRPPSAALLGMVLALADRPRESVDPLVRAVVAGEDVLAEVVRTAARALSAEGAHDEAAQLLRAVHERYPRDTGLLADLAHTLVQAGQPTEAADASVAAGALSAELERFDDALRHFALAEGLVEGHALAALGRCQALAATGRLAEAQADLARLRREQPHLAGAHAVTAIALAQAGQDQEARAVVDAALRTFPDDPWLLDTRIRLLLAAGQVDAALSVVEHALHIDNTDREWQCLRAEALLARDPADAEAVQLLQELAAAIPDGVTPVVRVTTALAAAGHAGAALRAVERALDDQRGDPVLLALQVRLLSQIGRHREVLPVARQALDRGLGAAAFGLPLAESLLALGRHEEALKAAEQVLGAEPSSPLGHRVRGLALYRAGRYREALADLDGPGLAGPDPEVDGRDEEWEVALTQSLTQVAQRALATGELDDAHRLLERAAQIAPRDVRVRAGLAELLRLRGDYAHALQHAELGLAVDPTDPSLVGTRAQILFGLHQDGHAEEEFRRALSLDPDLVWARTELGELLRMQRRYREALQHLERAVELAPNDPWPRASRGAAEYALDRYDKARQSLEVALELKEDYGWAHGVLAAVLKDIDRLDEAVVSAERSLELEPRLGWVWEVRGSLWLLAPVGSPAAVVRQHARPAQVCYARALELDPESWEAGVGLGESLVLSGDPDGAYDVFARTAKLVERASATDADAQTGLGWSLIRLRDYDNAVEAFVRAMALDSRHVSASFDLCLALLCRDDREVAFEEFAQAAARLRTVRHTGRRRFLARRARRDLDALVGVHLTDEKLVVEASRVLESLEGSRV